MLIDDAMHVYWPASCINTGEISNVHLVISVLFIGRSLPSSLLQEKLKFLNGQIVHLRDALVLLMTSSP